MIKAVRLPEVADPQMDVADAQTVGSRGVVAGRGSVSVSRSSMSSWSVAIATDPALHGQSDGIPVGIDLDAVAFGIVEIDGFGDEVVGEARQGNPVARGMDQPAREVLARRHQEGGVKEPGGVARLRCAACGKRLERQQPHATGAELRAGGGALDHGQADHVAVEVGDRIEVADPQASPCRPASACG